jgi:hypothetical protein
MRFQRYWWAWRMRGNPYISNGFNFLMTMWRYLDGSFTQTKSLRLCAGTRRSTDSLTKIPGSHDSRGIWNDIRGNIPESGVHTIYPPLRQGVFRLAHAIAPGSVLVLKSSMVIMDLLATVFLALALAAAGLPAEWLLLYAWNPLVIKAFAASGHSDAIAVTAIAALAYFLLKGAKFAASASFALVVLAKLIPIVLFPFVARRIGWRNSILTLLMILLGYLPFLDAGMLRWRFHLRALLAIQFWAICAGSVDCRRLSSGPLARRSIVHALRGGLCYRMVDLARRWVQRFVPTKCRLVFGCVYCSKPCRHAVVPDACSSPCHSLRPANLDLVFRDRGFRHEATTRVDSCLNA